MSYAPFPSNASPAHARSASLRLGDAAQIAAERLETSGDGSLKEALAGAVASKDAPADDIQNLADRIEAAQAGLNADLRAQYAAGTAPHEATQFVDPAVSAPEFETAMLGLREWSDDRAAVAAELAEMNSQPLFLQAEAEAQGQAGAGGTSWQPAAPDAERYVPEHEPPQPETAPLQVIAEAQQFAPMSEPQQFVPASEPAPLPAPVNQPAAASPADTAPATDALDAAAKLAADANAAVAALESLSRMLEDHQRAAAAQPEAPAPEMAHQVPQQPPRVPHPVPRAQPEPRPALDPAAPLPAAVLPEIKPPVPVREGRHFDMHGFFAGFALSWAIGAVLYIYLMAG